MSKPLMQAGEQCVVCAANTGIASQADVRHRLFYVSGVGRLCRHCWHALDQAATGSVLASVSPTRRRRVAS